jgi:hypothetical protein
MLKRRAGRELNQQTSALEDDARQKGDLGVSALQYSAKISLSAFSV